MSELTLKLIREAKEKRSTFLDLGNCGLDEIPEELFDLEWLEELNFGYWFIGIQQFQFSRNQERHNLIKIIPEKIRNLKKLKTLHLSENQIVDISHLANLTNLTKLNLCRNQIKEIAPLAQLTNLTEIELSSNQISDISSLAYLTNLTKLYLSDNQITDIRPLSQLANLTLLELSLNPIDDIRPLSRLINLTVLDLSSNQITYINSLAQLVNVTELYLDNNQITDLKPLEQLVNLTKLNLSVNPIDEINSLAKLTKLTELYLFNNQIKDIRHLNQLRNLIKLDLSRNQISNISPLAQFMNLTLLNLSGNQIRDISPIKDIIEKGIDVKWINDFTNEGIIIENNPLTIPPSEVVQQGAEAILRYFKELEKGSYKINEARLLIVGQGGSGKTTLRRKLKNPDAPLPEPGDTTRGIETEVLDYELQDQSYKLRIWDFGGQNIQHYAHQFFLTDSSLYALLTNEREQNPNFKYWLNIIEMLGGKSPVLIVQNEIAGHCEPIKNIAGIRSRFENVVSPVHSIDLSKAKEDIRFEKLKREILHLASGLEHVNKEYPVSYLHLRNRLDKEVQQGKHFITWAEYRQICLEEKVREEALMKDIAGVYSFLGTCLYFKDDIYLRNYVFLNPQWIIDALFCLLYHEKIIEQIGEFSEEDTLTIWDSAVYENMHDKLLHMMEKFELCFRIKDSNRFIVPQRLPAAKESYNWEEKDTTKVEYKYKFMPKGIITRITCRLHEKIKKDGVWNDAVIFQDKEAKVFVREVYSEERLSIEASGRNKEELLNRVIDEIDDIHRKSKFANLQVEKLVPCTCVQCSSGKEPHFFNYDTLCLLLDEGEFSERCQKSRKMMDIREVLKTTGIKFNQDRDKHFEERLSYSRQFEPNREEPKLKAFISYSHKDGEYKDVFKSAISPLIRQNKITLWDDGSIIAGQKWREEIYQHLAEADIVFCLISQDFISSDFCYDDELQKALEAYDN